MQINIEQDVSLALIAAICGLAFPIIIQTIGQIDTKYGSTRLIERIKRSWQFYFFIVSLISAIIVRIYYCFAPERNIDCGNFNHFIDNSAMFLVYFVLLVLLTSLFLFTFLVIEYYSPTKLLKNISNKMIRKENNKSSISEDDNSNDLFPEESKPERDFKDWTDLVISVILSPNYETVSKTVFTAYESLYKYVATHNSKLAYQESIYPSYFYNSIRSINKAVCSQEPQLTSAHNSNIATKIFIDDFQKTRISSQSYNCIWMCLSEQLFHNRTDLIVEYWTAAYQHYSMFLKRLSEGSVEDKGMSTEQKITAAIVQNRDFDRKKFKLFNCALGALLLYHQKYALLIDLFRYKNSTYEIDSLIPNSYSEIIDIYLNFNIADPFWVEQQYPFVNVRGVNSSNEIKFWIEKYLAILLIRVEILTERDGRKGHTEMPSIPRNLSDLRFYEEELSNLKNVIEVVYQDKIVDDIYPNHPELSLFLAKFDGYISSINKEYNRIKKEQEINQDILNNFYQSIKEQYDLFKSKMQIISDAQIGDVDRPYTCDLKCEEWKCEDKGVFCKKQDVGRSSYDSVFSAMVIHNLEFNLGHKLLLHSKRTIVGKYVDLFNIIDKLNINEEYIVITTRIEFEYFEKNGIEVICQNKELSHYTYKNITIINFTHLQLHESCMWVLKKSELPIFSFEKHPSNKQYTKDIKILNDGLFANVIDLFRSDDIRKEINNEIDLEMKILIWVECNIKLNYVDQGKILRIPLLNPFSRETSLDIANITPFDEYFK